jgi:DNA repair exonuclease SbcCD ATPase subunit
MGQFNCRKCISCGEEGLYENLDSIHCLEQDVIVYGDDIRHAECSYFSPKGEKGEREKTLETENKELKDKTEELREELQMCQRSWLLEVEKIVALMKQLGRRDKKIKKLKKRNDNIANQMIDMTNACDTCKKNNLKDVNRKQEQTIRILRAGLDRCSEKFTKLKELNKSMGESVGELTDLKYAFTSLQETNETLGNDNLKLIDTIENLKKELTDSKTIISEIQESEKYCVLDNIKLEEKIKGQRKEIEQLARLSNRNADMANEQNGIVNRLLREDN